jgi:hypothetical protein
MLARHLYLVAIAAALGCATASTTHDTGTGTAAVRRNPNLITAEEIATINVANAYEAVERLRPNFLRSRGRTTLTANAIEYPNVYLNRQRYGDIGQLRNILASTVREIRYYSPAEAGTQFGLDNANGVIEVTLK